MKKAIGIMILLSAVRLSGCSADKTDASMLSLSEPSVKQATAQSEQVSGDKLIGASPHGNVKLFAVNETVDEIRGVMLEIDGSRKTFDWNILNTGMRPQVFYTDLTGDDKEEAVVLINTGRGTELNTYDIHVMNAENFKEIKVPNAVDIADESVDSTVVPQGNMLDIHIRIRGMEYKQTYLSEGGKYSDKLTFGAINIYAIENGKIAASVAGNVKFAEFVGSVRITYGYDHAANEFKADQIVFDADK